MTALALLLQWRYIAAGAASMDSRIRKWGNSAVVRLPASLLAQLELEVGAPVKLDVEAGRIIIEPAVRRRYELDDLVAAITPQNRHGALDWGPPVGREAQD
ncbi:MAG TPA: AbrB/MazE/SpoVT family DNA-binding domain-containing protein [Burkholderiaceae bacterium]|nr:AbrB/MazE/SpoVT family DNA-binding domain-containing protein [Burkholderiaceae bacterium]